MDPDILANEPDLTKDRVYDFLGRYVRWVHSNQFICMALKVNSQASYVDIIGPGDIAYVIAIIKNSGEMWDRDIRMKELGDKAMGKQEKKMQLLFTQGEGQKRMKGESLWNKEGMRFFLSAEEKWEDIYNDQESMSVVYNKWEKWITTKGKGMKIGDGTQKTFHMVMGTWNDNPAVTTTNESNDEEEVGAESGYHSDRGQTQTSIGWAKGALREVKVTEEIGKKDLDSESDDGKKKGNWDGKQLFEEKAGGGKDDSPAKNVRKRNAQSPVVETRQ